MSVQEPVFRENLVYAPVKHSFVLEASLFAFAVFVFMGGTPFQDADYSLLASDSVGEGDSGRQVFYISLMLLSFIPVLQTKLKDVLQGLPVSLIALCVWCLITVPFAVEPGIAFRRWGLAIVLIITVANFLTALGVERSMQIFQAAILTLVVASLLSIPIIPGAVHGGGERDQALVGAWRGFFQHKNHASAVSAVGLAMFAHQFAFDRKPKTFFYALLMFVFLIGTKGKSALGLVAPSIGIGLFYVYCYRRAGGRYLFTIISCVGIVLGALFVFMFQDTIGAVLSDPTSFTGRVAIWETVIAYARDHPIFGAGFGSFWQIGSSSPVYRISSEVWLLNVAHSHDGYLEMLVTTGFPGLIITIMAVAVLPLRYLLTASGVQARLNGQLFSILVFGLLYNFTETHILARDRQVWIMILVIMCSFKVLHTRQKKEQQRVQRLNAIAVGGKGLLGV